MAWQVHVNDGYASLHFAGKKGREDEVKYRLKDGSGADTSPFCMPHFRNTVHGLGILSGSEKVKWIFLIEMRQRLLHG
jgi:hypothetical protein